MTSTNFEIRAYQSGDLDTLQQIREIAFRPVFQSFRDIVGREIADVAFARAEAEQAEHLSELCDPKTSQQVYVALVDQKIVGFVAVSLDHDQRLGELGLNCVHPDFANRGVGTALYEFALAEMKAAGMAVAVVGTGGDASHAPARRAYAKVGFAATLPNQWMYRVL